MKKVSLVVMGRDRERSLEKLREAGVVHLEKKSVSSEALSKLLATQSRIVRALGSLSRYTVKQGAHTSYMPFSPVSGDLVAHILGLGDERKILQEQLMYLSKERWRVEAWGDFDPHAFAFLKQHGIRLIPYLFPRATYDRLTDDNIKLIIITSDKRFVRAFSVGTEIPNMTPFAFSAQSLSAMGDRMEALHYRIAEIEAEYEALAHRKKDVEAEHDRILEEIEFETARAGMEIHEEASAVSWLTGYVLVEKLGVLKRYAAEEGWALVWQDPARDDRPPTLIRNKPAVRIIQPLFSFLGTVPGYWEYDISLSYMIFLSLFFAMIFGDAGYGVLLLVISLALGFGAKKKSGKFSDVSLLFLLFSCCTMAWGTITGSWFAIPHENLPPLLHSLIIPPFDNSGPVTKFPLFLQSLFSLPEEIPVDEMKTRWGIQFLCFSVGTAQLVWGRGKNIIKKLPSFTALAQFGWLVLMIGMYFLVLFMLLQVPLPTFAVYFIAFGLAMYFIFSEQKAPIRGVGNFFKNILKSFTNILTIFLNAVGSFADIISYIRLFAVGLAGSTIAASFNAMAIPADGFGTMGIGFLLKVLVAVFILIFGHALNIAMNCLSVIVHGVRLNLLEYAGNHLGMEWSGYAYKPFSKKQI
jgi:V/A-type H+-transporting ATPase subunit I